MEPQFAEINGAACRYSITGDGSRTLVLVHELGGSLNSWDGFLPLLPATLRVLRHDLRGAGMSEKVRGRLSIDTLCDDLAALIEHTGIRGRVIVAGAAMGAAIAVRFATRFTGLVERLVLIGPALGVPPERQAAAAEITDKLEREGLRSISDGLLPNAFPEALWRSVADKRQAIARWFGADPEGYAAAYRILIDTNLRDELDRIACPTLVLAGKHDPFVRPDALEQVAATIPQGRFAVVDGGHFMAVQNPDRLAEVLLPFLAEG